MENKRLYTIYIKNWKDPISGIIESSSNYWVLIKRIPNDYILDGFAFIQKCHIESYKRTEEDRFKEKSTRQKVSIQSKGISNEKEGHLRKVRKKSGDDDSKGFNIYY